jgi:Cytochrome c3
VLVATVLALLLAAPAKEDCLTCHGERDAQATDGRSVHVEAQRVKAGVHGALSCSDCHAGISELPHAERLPPVDCGACH